MNVLHIAAHLGGGAGKAIMGLAIQCKKKGEEQKVLLLEEPEKKVYIEQGKKEGIPIILLSQDKEQVIQLFEWADVIVISWWNHPAMAGFLARWPKIPCRIILWCHVNGCVYPYLPYSFAIYFERIFITTRYTLENPLWTKEEQAFIRKKSYLLHGMGEFYPEEIIRKQDYQIGNKFIVGYVGTLNYSKIHPEYLEYCEEAIKRIPDIHFLMIGDVEESILEAVKKKGILSYFTFTGYVKDVYSYYQQMDVFGYLLREDNYATTENAILEAMASGIPVIVYQNHPEEYILTENETGFFIKEKEEYVKLLQKLHDSDDLRRRIGEQERAHVIETYSSEKNCQNFLVAIKEVVEMESRIYSFQKCIGDLPYEWFYHYTGYEKEFFSNIEVYSEEELRNFIRECPAIYREKSKGSILHFARYYPEDERLKKLKEEVEKIGSLDTGREKSTIS